jgi:hypothetical protein
MKTLRSYLCWLLGHSFICLHRNQWGTPDTHFSTSSGWVCQHCNYQRTEQWDS